MNTTRRIMIVVSTVIALAASAGPALAGTFNENGKGSYIEVPPTSAQTFVSSGSSGQPTIVHVTTVAGGFNWGDAAIGAAAAIAIAVLVIGGVLVLTQHRPGGDVRHA